MELEQLRDAIRNKREEIAVFLIKSHRDIGLYDRVLSLAVEKMMMNVVKLLLECGAHVHYSDNEAICIAASKPNVEIIDLLVQYGAWVNAREGQPLINAVKKGYVCNVRALLKHGAGEYSDAAMDYIQHNLKDGAESDFMMTRIQRELDKFRCNN